MGRSLEEQASPGAQITIVGFHLGDSQGTKKLKIGPVEVPVQSWADREIHTIAPALSPGSYPINIEKNGEVVSKISDYYFELIHSNLDLSLGSI
ncbi:IPT/TIG domain-containing protein [Acidobacteriota bacterium]